MVKSLMLQVPLVLFVVNYGFSQEYYSKIKQLVYSGEELNPKVNKHLVQLVIVGVNFSNFGPEFKKGSCSGSIISDRWIITSAHCFFPFITFDAKINRKEGGEFHQIAEAKDVTFKDMSFKLDDYSAQNMEKDLALVFTIERIEFNDHVQPIALATESVQVGRSAIISGFGEIARGVLGARQGVVKIKTCPKRGTTLLCSDSVVKSASGDSGGSLVYKNQLVGVTSSGCRDVFYFKRCITYYVNVAANLDWIYEKIAQ